MREKERGWTEHFKVQCVINLRLYEPWIIWPYSHKVLLLLLLPACFCWAITCCGHFKKVHSPSGSSLAGPWQSCLIMRAPVTVLLYRTQNDRPQKNCINHCGSGPEQGKFLIYTMPWVYLVCFNRFVGDIQWFWVKRNNFLLRQIKRNVAFFVVVVASFNEPLNFTSGTETFKKFVPFHTVCTES